MKDESGKKIMKGFEALRPQKLLCHRKWSHWQRTKATTTCVTREEIEFKDYKTFLENNRTILRTYQKFTGEAYNVFTEKVNKVSLSTSDNKRIQALYGFISSPCSTGPGRVSKKELIKLSKVKK